MQTSPLFIGISLLHHQFAPSASFPLPSYKSADYYSSISEGSNSKEPKPLQSYNSPVITGREFEEKSFLPSDFSISSIRDHQSVFTLTDSNEFRMQISTKIMPFLNNHPSLFKKHNKLQLVNEENVERTDKENEVNEPKSTGRANVQRYRHKQNKSITALREENQWFGLKTSRVHSPQPNSRFKHLYC